MKEFVWGYVVSFISIVNEEAGLGGAVTIADSPEEAEVKARQALEAETPPHQIVQLIVSRDPVAIYSKVHFHEDGYRELRNNLSALDLTGESPSG